ncbi:MAG: RNA methyltransferase [Candidatus Thermoplasmatota archaeon]|jgi:TrmH family RNA methyltransferase|nr:RNA methyltransferase [Candidatus Thermoplasmatota archaeon]
MSELKFVQSIRIIVVEPKNPGNLGAIARLMKNFGLSDLVVVNTHRIPSEDSFRSMKGSEILARCKRVDSLTEASRGLEYIVGTSGVKSESPKEVLRNYLNPKEFVKLSERIKGKVGIVLGREDIGLTNEELSMCDFFVHIPADEGYPILNVSSAASILFYELFGSTKSRKVETISRRETDRLIEKFREGLVSGNYPKHRIEKTTLMFRRIMSRSVLSPYEYRILMGAIGCAHKGTSVE